MRPHLWLGALLAGLTLTAAQETSETETTDRIRSLLTLDGTVTGLSDAHTRTGDYISYTSTRTLGTNHGGMITGSSGSVVETASVTGTGTGAENATATTNSVTVLRGGGQTKLVGNNTANATATGTSTSAQPTNTQPCNNYPEFCDRKYSNLTMVAAHNSPFVQKGSVAANQALKVKAQLDDGIRMRMSPFLHQSYYHH